MTASTSYTPNEEINTCLPAATYYVKVNGYGHARSEYLLDYEQRPRRCNTSCVDDTNEDDDTFSQARATTYPTFSSAGNKICPNDDDWFKTTLYTGEKLDDRPDVHAVRRVGGPRPPPLPKLDATSGRATSTTSVGSRRPRPGRVVERARGVHGADGLRSRLRLRRRRPRLQRRDQLLRRSRSGSSECGASRRRVRRALAAGCATSTAPDPGLEGLALAKVAPGDDHPRTKLVDHRRLVRRRRNGARPRCTSSARARRAAISTSSGRRSSSTSAR